MIKIKSTLLFNIFLPIFSVAFLFSLKGMEIGNKEASTKEQLRREIRRIVHFSKKLERFEKVKQLLETGGIDINDDLFGGHTALHLAVSDCTDPKITEMILAMGADVNKINGECMTPLHMSFIFSPNDNTYNHVKLLIEHPKMDYALQDKHGETVFHMLAEGEHNDWDSIEVGDRRLSMYAVPPIVVKKVLEQLKNRDNQGIPIALTMLMARKRKDCIISMLPKFVLFHVLNFVKVPNLLNQRPNTKEVLVPTNYKGLTAYEELLNNKENNWSRHREESFEKMKVLLDPKNY